MGADLGGWRCQRPMWVTVFLCEGPRGSLMEGRLAAGATGWPWNSDKVQDQGHVQRDISGPGALPS